MDGVDGRRVTRRWTQSTGNAATEMPGGRHPSDGVDLRPIAGSKIFVYMSQYKQKKRFIVLQRAVFPDVLA